MNKAVLWIVILVVVVGGIWWAMSNGTPAVDTSDTSAAVIDATLPAEGDSMLVGEQKAGKEVVVTSVVLKTGGSLVVHKDMNGEAGEVLGTLTLGAGMFENSKVMLSKEVKAGESVHVMAHADLNADGKYSEEEEGSVLIDAQGNALSYMVKVN